MADSSGGKPATGRNPMGADKRKRKDDDDDDLENVCQTDSSSSEGSEENDASKGDDGRRLPLQINEDDDNLEGVSETDASGGEGYKGRIASKVDKGKRPAVHIDDDDNLERDVDTEAGDAAASGDDKYPDELIKPESDGAGPSRRPIPPWGREDWERPLKRREVAALKAERAMKKALPGSAIKSLADAYQRSVLSGKDSILKRNIGGSTPKAESQSGGRFYKFFWNLLPPQRNAGISYTSRRLETIPERVRQISDGQYELSEAHLEALRFAQAYEIGYELPTVDMRNQINELYHFLAGLRGFHQEVAFLRMLYYITETERGWEGGVASRRAHAQEIINYLSGLFDYTRQYILDRNRRRREGAARDNEHAARVSAARSERDSRDNEAEGEQLLEFFDLFASTLNEESEQREQAGNETAADFPEDNRVENPFPSSSYVDDGGQEEKEGNRTDLASTEDSNDEEIYSEEG